MPAGTWPSAVRDLGRISRERLAGLTSLGCPPSSGCVPRWSAPRSSHAPSARASPSVSLRCAAAATSLAEGRKTSSFQAETQTDSLMPRHKTISKPSCHTHPFLPLRGRCPSAARTEGETRGKAALAGREAHGGQHCLVCRHTADSPRLDTQHRIHSKQQEGGHKTSLSLQAPKYSGVSLIILTTLSR